MSGNRSSFFGDLGPGVKNLIIITLLLWLFDITNCNKHLFGFDMHELFGLHYWEAGNFNPFQMLSYMFVHDRTSPMHVFFNMFNLFMFGTMMERRWGTPRFLMFYFICGIGGAIAQQIVWSSEFMNQSVQDLARQVFVQGDITDGGRITQFNVDGHIITSLDGLRKEILGHMALTIGASAGTFGVMVAFAMTFPNLPLYFFFIPVPIKAKYMISAFVVIEVLETLTRATDGIAHLAHLGGIVFGVLLILWWRKTGEDQGPMF